MYIITVIITYYTIMRYICLQDKHESGDINALKIQNYHVNLASLQSVELYEELFAYY